MSERQGQFDGDGKEMPDAVRGVDEGMLRAGLDAEGVAERARGLEGRLDARMLSVFAGMAEGSEGAGADDDGPSAALRFGGPRAERGGVWGGGRAGARWRLGAYMAAAAAVCVTTFTGLAWLRPGETARMVARAQPGREMGRAGDAKKDGEALKDVAGGEKRELSAGTKVPSAAPAQATASSVVLFHGPDEARFDAKVDVRLGRFAAQNASVMKVAAQVESAEREAGGEALNVPKAVGVTRYAAFTLPLADDEWAAAIVGVKEGADAASAHEEVGVPVSPQTALPAANERPFARIARRGAADAAPRPGGAQDARSASVGGLAAKPSTPAAGAPEVVAEREDILAAHRLAYVLAARDATGGAQSKGARPVFTFAAVDELAQRAVARPGTAAALLEDDLLRGAEDGASVRLMALWGADDGAALNAGDPASAKASAAAGAITFGALDVFVEADGRGLGSYQVEIVAPPECRLVGVEGGDGGGVFAAPAYYDAGALQSERIVLAGLALDPRTAPGERRLALDVPVQRVRVARVHLAIMGAPAAECTATMVAAGDASARRLEPRPLVDLKPVVPGPTAPGAPAGAAKKTPG
ncbi:hypothetical protein BH11PLA1_BH11PLA1_12150 [soil metagenome]